MSAEFLSDKVSKKYKNSTITNKQNQQKHNSMLFLHKKNIALYEINNSNLSTIELNIRTKYMKHCIPELMRV